MIGDVDRDYWRRDHIVIGVDEVGRGALAGPVVAGAVVLDPLNVPDGINDSKKLSKTRRVTVASAIHVKAVGLGVYAISPSRIDEVGIRHATLEAMAGAVTGIGQKLRALMDDGVKLVVLVDGLDIIPAVPHQQRAIVRGDNLSLSVAAASVVAKVYRDRLMRDLSNTNREYGWTTNVGYGTADHIQAIRQYGVTRHHRRNFVARFTKET